MRRPRLRPLRTSISMLRWACTGCPTTPFRLPSISPWTRAYSNIIIISSSSSIIPTGARRPCRACHPTEPVLLVPISTTGGRACQYGTRQRRRRCCSNKLNRFNNSSSSSSSNNISRNNRSSSSRSMPPVELRLHSHSNNIKTF
ncbi:hypothetical protein BDY21DRAFT_354195 [Lineolata rhizophorae]|uniref:Uncharacterized protein n=1 Tax=Lineolata rhizophorae TaxID=578093 RepID=A0A6A6NRK6_9PEZI|nr:hypothetical protein BDY21DRAFT_354195 [Lineolata rhizophorae]